MEILSLALIVLNLIITLAFTVLVLRFFKRMPDLIQNVLNDVGAQLNEIFANPTIKKAYSIMGKQSGQVRADAALQNKVANKFVENSPVIKKALEVLDITPIEGLQLLNDPFLGPMIQSFMGLNQNPGNSGAPFGGIGIPRNPGHNQRVMT